MPESLLPSDLPHPPDAERPAPDVETRTEFLSEALRSEMRMAASAIEESEPSVRGEPPPGAPREEFLLTEIGPLSHEAAAAPEPLFSAGDSAEGASVNPDRPILGDVSLKALADALLDNSSPAANELLEIEADMIVPEPDYAAETERADPGAIAVRDEAGGIDATHPADDLFLPDDPAAPADSWSAHGFMEPVSEQSGVSESAAAAAGYASPPPLPVFQKLDAENDCPWMVGFGAALVIAGLFQAGRVPALLMGTARGHAAELVQHAWTGPAMAILHGAAATVLIATGLGAATARRWAPPIIHALGWMVLLTVLFLLAQFTAVLFHGGGEDAGLTGAFGILFKLIFAGVILPLAAIAYFDRQRVLETCAAADPRVRWTDLLPIPVLMTGLTAFAAALICAAAAVARLPFPPGSEASSSLLWIAAAAAWGFAGWLSLRRRRAGWLLSLGLFAVLGTVAALALRGVPLGRALLAGLEAPVPGDTSGIHPLQRFAGWATLLLPLLAILLMSRKSFSTAAPAETR